MIQFSDGDIRASNLERPRVTTQLTPRPPLPCSSSHQPPLPGDTLHRPALLLSPAPATATQRPARSSCSRRRGTKDISVGAGDAKDHEQGHLPSPVPPGHPPIPPVPTALGPKPKCLPTDWPDPPSGCPSRQHLVPQQRMELGGSAARPRPCSHEAAGTLLTHISPRPWADVTVCQPSWQGQSPTCHRWRRGRRKAVSGRAGSVNRILGGPGQVAGPLWASQPVGYATASSGQTVQPLASASPPPLLTPARGAPDPSSFLHLRAGPTTPAGPCSRQKLF